MPVPIDEGVDLLTELHGPGGPGIGVGRGDLPRPFRQPVAHAALGSEIEEREDPGLEVGRPAGRRGTTVGSAAGADPAGGQAAARSPGSAGTPADPGTGEGGAGAGRSDGR